MSGSGRGPEHLLDQSGPPEPGIPEDEERTPGLSGSGDDAVPAVSASTEDGDGPGPLIATVTQTLAVPYRPSSDSACGNGGYLPTCFSGYAFNATFDFSSANVSVPSEVIATVALNTETTGAASTGEAGPYNFLHVGVGGHPTVGDYGDAYVDYEATNGLENDSKYDYTTMIRLEAAPSSPGTAEDCKTGGFEQYGFSNQGQCIASVKANENSAR